MRRLVPRKKDSVLTGHAFDKLLAALDPDRERAGARYELLRAKLVTFFERRGGDSPAEGADETLDRVARRVEAGLALSGLEIQSYVYGVARNVLREGRKASRPVDSIDAVPPPQLPVSDPPSDRREVEDRRYDCMQRCFADLPEGKRELVAEYHAAEGREGIERRHALAQRLGISTGALRVRVHRVREELEACLRACMQDDETE